MRWESGRRSTNVDDRRSLGGGGIAIGGMGTLVIIVLALLFGVDPMALLQNMPQQQQAPGGGGGAVDPAQDELKEFVSVVLADTEDVWTELFREQGEEYVKPTLVLFSGRVDSACGIAGSAVGPFYCPRDQKVYIDLDFFEELDRRLGAPGDFAQAYVLAHEIGHHVQTLLGISDKVQAARQRVSERESNQLSVRQELQADFFAGVWAHHAQRTRQLLEEGDIEEAMRAAQAIGDDRLQKQSQGYVVPDAFTHGTSEQRARWFKKGLTTGDIRQGDTFSSREL